MNVNGIKYALAGVEIDGGRLMLYTVDPALIDVVLRARLERAPLVLDEGTFTIAQLGINGTAAQVGLEPLRLVS